IPVLVKQWVLVGIGVKRYYKKMIPFIMEIHASQTLSMFVQSAVQPLPECCFTPFGAIGGKQRIRTHLCPKKGSFTVGQQGPIQALGLLVPFGPLLHGKPLWPCDL